MARLHDLDMNRISNRDKLLQEGLRVVHERGYAGASVRDIVRAAGVPQGSFTNHFASKEAFGLEIIDLYFAGTETLLKETLRNDALPPLQRLRAYVEASRNGMCRDGMRRGCLIGNFSIEASEHSEAIRARVAAIFNDVQNAIEYCLRAAVLAGELASQTNCRDLAGFILSSMQGAVLLGKAQRSTAPIESFERMLFSQVLRVAGV